MKVISFFLLFCFSVFGSEVGFIFFGDSGTGGKAQYRVAAGMQKFCERELCQFGIMLGDNFYTFGVGSVKDKKFETMFVKPYGPLGIRFRVALGNHDYWGNIQAQLDYTFVNPQWFMPMPFYKATEKREDLTVSLYQLDTNRFGKQQIEFMKRYIDDEADWKIVYGHHPIYSYGSHGDEDDLIDDLLPIIKGKADFYLSGHDHDKQILKDDSLVYVVSGAAAKLRGVDNGPKTVWSSETYGFAHLLLNKEKAVLKFLDENGEEQFKYERFN